MTFTVTSLTRCAGQSHYRFALTFGSGQTAALEATLAELQGDPPEDRAEARKEILDRLRSALKEADAGTFAQARAAVEGVTFRV